ncbi:hypothetical protein OVS_02645 [Mycoplasma ovis str. Michigan]|uniref:Uncharacterized protein n=1 Tax=Mycoplasma ovis str. Michigan TaxID=1415773 RepID=A0ABM5P244_9MOLU|nr:hypothetical protein [Mycoplasma ovis]AHC40344.1 hypothetical protein OVS_02645 [Mycoplasma ovis str. Michigan]
MLLKKILTSIFVGSSIGTGPYLIATQLPNSEVVKAPDEDVGFGKRCLLDQEICDFMEQTEFKQDGEGSPEENPYITEPLKQKLNSDWEKFIKTREDDFCGFGFYGKKDVNTLEKCYQFLIEQHKKKKKK